jgi:alpha-galactosidase
VTFTATVTGSSPTGSVAFYDGITLLGTTALNGSAQAALTTSGLAVGWRPITARYLGNAANGPSTTSSALFQSITPPAGNGKLKVFILAGQSNMQGKGRVELGRDPNNYNNTNFVGGLGTLRNMLNKNPNKYGYLADTSPIANTPNTTVPGWRTLPNVWVSYFTSGANASATQARKGYLDADFGNGASSGQIGPEYGFGLTVGSQLGDPVLIIKTAWGGNSLAWNFRPPSSGTTTLSNINTMRDAYNFMVADVRFILNNLGTELNGFSYNPANGYEIAGFGWHQGWNDRISDGATAEYEANMTNLITDLRAEFGVPNMPVVIGTTSMANVDNDNRGLLLVAGQKTVALKPQFAGTVTTVDTKQYDFGTAASPSSEGYHWNWNSESYFNIGEQMGQAMVGLLAGQSSAKDILSFSMPGQTASTISGDAINVTVPTGTDVTALVPAFTVSPLATAAPLTGVARDFTSPQTYTVTAQNLSTRTYTITVSFSSSPYAAWASNPAQGLTAGVNDAPTDDPDFDGINNLMEFVLNGQPTVASTTILPNLTKPAGSWVFAYDRSVASRPPGTTQIVEYDDNLSGWTQLAIPLGSAPNVTITPQGATDRVEVTLPPLGPKGFVRLKVNP